jgi:hypothetical protein
MGRSLQSSAQVLERWVIPPALIAQSLSQVKSSQEMSLLYSLQPTARSLCRVLQIPPTPQAQVLSIVRTSCTHLGAWCLTLVLQAPHVGSGRGRLRSYKCEA